MSFASVVGTQLLLYYLICLRLARTFLPYSRLVAPFIFPTLPAVLQLRLQQRRTREQLVDQGIMPPLKSPAAFHGQIRSLERARTENFLKHKIRSRPERAELVRMHILQETGAEPSLQATQMKLKRARLADNLNEKIAQRPGPMELVEKNILPVDSSLKEAIIVGQVNYAKVLDEDGCYDAMSPEQPASQESQSSAPSPGESKVPETPSPGPAPAVLTTTMLQLFPTTDFPKAVSANEQPLSCTAVHTVQSTAAPAPSKPGPTLVKVAELKLELKLRGLPVSGTKTDLIERLKPFQENTNITPPSTIPATTTISSIPVEVTTTTTPTIVLPVHQVAPEMMCSTPPNSPIPFDQSCLQQDGGMSEASSEIQKGSSGSPQAPLQVPEEKDRRLHEKERQIEELMRKLEQEQRLVEELKMQLEVEKRGQIDSMSLSPSHTSVSSAPTILSSNVVKMEGPIQSNCSSTTIPNSILNSQALSAPRPQVVKLEDVTVSSGQPLQLQTQTQLITQIQHQNQVTTSPKLGPQTQHQSQPAPPSLQQFFITHPAGVSQVLGQPQTLLTTTGQAGTQIFVPVSLPNSATAIQLPSTTVSLQDCV
ncbi:hypothetical protein ATANTOWER_013479 [Ataeniobius toweri]|uniref:SAP domain-containing protein n=1 Tax=Ataeniobius toweri TaxID=208326 RepID=A0ABU7AQK4_9TELE|nr:hypothetical protein [Ataeniobius toweri]